MGMGKKGNVGIGKSLNQCMRVIWAIQMTHLTLINLVRELMVLISATAFNIGHY